MKPVKPDDPFSLTTLMALLRQLNYPTTIWLCTYDFNAAWERSNAAEREKNKDADGLFITVWCDGYKIICRQETPQDIPRPERIVHMQGKTIAEILAE